MAINKKLIHFKNKTDFDNEVANENILDHSIVFIQNSKEISTHGTVYKSVNWSILAEPELYEWVDLGLPSGTLWADRNVGAEKPEDSGLYFAWGEIEGYSAEDVENGMKQFNWSDYKFNIDGSYSNFSKYNSTDNLTTLEQADNAAYQSDNTCRMPTKANFEELVANTTSVWETLNGMGGRRFTSNLNGNSIFIPAAGTCDDGSVYDVGSNGFYWSSSLDSFSGNACILSFYFDIVGVYDDGRCYGFSIRPVKSK